VNCTAWVGGSYRTVPDKGSDTLPKFVRAATRTKQSMRHLIAARHKLPSALHSTKSLDVPQPVFIGAHAHLDETIS
jgi:hypothetical protein